MNPFPEIPLLPLGTALLDEEGTQIAAGQEPQSVGQARAKLAQGPQAVLNTIPANKKKLWQGPGTPWFLDLPRMATAVLGILLILGAVLTHPAVVSAAKKGARAGEFLG